MVDQHRAVLFGGYQASRVLVNDVYLFDFRTMVSTAKCTILCVQRKYDMVQSVANELLHIAFQISRPHLP